MEQTDAASDGSTMDASRAVDAGSVDAAELEEDGGSEPEHDSGPVLTGCAPLSAEPGDVVCLARSEDLDPHRLFVVWRAAAPSVTGASAIVEGALYAVVPLTLPGATDVWAAGGVVTYDVCDFDAGSGNVRVVHSGSLVVTPLVPEPSATRLVTELRFSAEAVASRGPEPHWAELRRGLRAAADLVEAIDMGGIAVEVGRLAVGDADVHLEVSPESLRLLAAYVENTRSSWPGADRPRWACGSSEGDMLACGGMRIALMGFAGVLLGAPSAGFLVIGGAVVIAGSVIPELFRREVETPGFIRAVFPDPVDSAFAAAERVVEDLRAAFVRPPTFAPITGLFSDVIDAPWRSSSAAAGAAVPESCGYEDEECCGVAGCHTPGACRTDGRCGGCGVNPTCGSGRACLQWQPGSWSCFASGSTTCGAPHYSGGVCPPGESCSACGLAGNPYCIRPDHSCVSCTFSRGEYAGVLPAGSTCCPSVSTSSGAVYWVLSGGSSDAWFSFCRPGEICMDPDTSFRRCATP